MNWFDQLSGVPVKLSPGVEKKIGMRPEVEDLGVIKQPNTICNVLGIGLHLGALDKLSLKEFLSLKQGTTHQRVRAESLCRQSLTALKREVASRVERRLSGLPFTPSAAFEELDEWAKGSGWEFATSMQSAFGGESNFSIQEGPGLRLLSITNDLELGAVRDAFELLVKHLAGQSLKVGSLDLLQMRFEQEGFYVNRLVKAARTQDIRRAEPEAIKAFVMEHDSSGYAEAQYCYGEAEEALDLVMRRLRDVIYLQLEHEDLEIRCYGPDALLPYAQRERLARMVEGDASPVGRFVKNVCDLLGNECLNERLHEPGVLDGDENYLGEFALVDTGTNVEEFGDICDYWNEYAWSGDDAAMMSLGSNAEGVIALITYLTLTERLLLFAADMTSEQIVEEPFRGTVVA